jgi:hypothetical protein
MPQRIQLSAKSNTHDIWIHVVHRVTGARGKVAVTLPYGVASTEYVNDRFTELGCNLKAIAFGGLAPAIVAPF